MEPEEQGAEEIYYGVIIPFNTMEQAKYAGAEVKRVVGYGSWIREGDFNED